MNERTEVAVLRPLVPFLRPDFVLDKAHNLRVTDLMEHNKTQSIGLIIFDLDNTLEDHWRKGSPSDPDQVLLGATIELFEKLHSANYTIAIASNCDDVRGQELKRVFLGLADVVATPKDARDSGARWGKKPTKGMYMYIQEQLELMGLQFSSAQTLMLGDQILKDVLFGKSANIKTVLTGKFGEHDDPRVEKYQREHELRLLQAIGFCAIDGEVQFPSKLTPTKEWVKAQSGLIAPIDLVNNGEY